MKITNKALHAKQKICEGSFCNEIRKRIEEGGLMPGN
jgi:hypothetical protein